MTATPKMTATTKWIAAAIVTSAKMTTVKIAARQTVKTKDALNAIAQCKRALCISI